MISTKSASDISLKFPAGFSKEFHQKCFEMSLPFFAGNLLEIISGILAEIAPDMLLGDIQEFLVESYLEFL